MPPPSDFPRGWTLNTTQNATGVAASITVPATAGVVHVLDAIYAKLVNTGTAAASTFGFSVTTAAGTVLTNLLVVPATTVSNDTLTLTALDIASSVGGTIVAQFNNAAAAGLWEEITIQGHDI